MLNLHDGTFWCLHSCYFEIECFCFGLGFLILQCKSIALHLAVYLVRQRTFSKGKLPEIDSLRSSISIMCEWNFWPNRWRAPSSNRVIFSFSNVFDLLASFSNNFKMFERCVYKTDIDTWSSRSVFFSINIVNASTGTSTASENLSRTSSNPYQSRDNGRITCKKFFSNFSNWWFVEIAVCSANSFFTMLLGRGTFCRFEEIGISINIFSLMSLSGI